MDELVEIYDNDGREYKAECPYCGHIIDINNYDDDELMELIDNYEIVEICCDKCNECFEAILE